jgi:hypothetical protein
LVTDLLSRISLKSKLNFKHKKQKNKNTKQNKTTQNKTTQNKTKKEKKENILVQDIPVSSGWEEIGKMRRQL